MADTTPTQDAPERDISVEWFIPPDLTSRYANNFIVQHGPGEMIISFFEIEPPIIVGDAEQKRAQTAALTSIRAKCTARIVITVDRAPELAKIISENYESYQQRVTAGEL